jgi:hypothetical protein
MKLHNGSFYKLSSSEERKICVSRQTKHVARRVVCEDDENARLAGEEDVVVQKC